MALGTYRLGPATVALAAASGTSDTLSSNITDSVTSIPLSDSTDFPSRGIVTIGTEEIYYSGNSSNTLTGCVRGFHGTSASTGTSGDTVTLSYNVLGDTLGGITVTQSETKQQLKTDQAGETPIDESITGVTVSVEANMAEITLENIAMLNRTTVEGTSPNRRVEVKSNVGYSLLTNSKKTLIIPFDGSAPSSAIEDMITIVKGGISSETSLTFDNSTQQTMKITITGYADTSNSNLVAVYGKES